MTDRSVARPPAALAAVLLVVVAPAASASIFDAISRSLEAAVTVEVEGAAYATEGEPERRLAERLTVETLWAPAAWTEVSAALSLAGDSDHEIERRLEPDWCERSPRPRSFEVGELAVAFHLPAADLTAGKVVTSWGVGDFLQPTDVVTPRDLTDPLRDRRLGVLGIVAELYAGDVEVSAALARHAPHRLPQAGFRWYPAGDLGGLEPRVELPSGRDAVIGAVRVSGSLHSFDWALVARRGPDAAPHLSLPDLTLGYPDATVLGGWLAWARGSVVLRGEVAVRRYDRHAGRAVEEDFATLLVGLERRFPALIAGNDATLIVELVRDHHLAGPRLAREIAVIDSLRLVSTGLSARLLSHDPTGWEIELGVVTDLEEGGGLVQALVRRNLGDRLDLELGADLIGAGGNPALAAIAANDRLVLRLVNHL